MKNVMYKIFVGCYIVAALVLVCACNDGLDIQQAYPFTVETLPVPKKLKVGETAEIRCQLVRSGYYQPTTYQIRYFQPDGKGKLEMDDGTVFLPNGCSNFRYRLITTTTKASNSFEISILINARQNIVGCVFICNFAKNIHYEQFYK